MTSPYDYYTKLRKDNPFTVEIKRIENTAVTDLLLTFDDLIVIDILPENLGNYYSYMSIQIKKYIKKQYGLTGKVLCTFYSNYKHNKEKRAFIVMNCDSELELDAQLYQ